MKLMELAAGYDDAAEKITARIIFLRSEISKTPGGQSAFQCELTHLLRVRKEIRKTGELCRRYYERGFWRDADYTFNNPTRRVTRRPADVDSGERRNKSGKLRKSTVKTGTSHPVGTDTPTAKTLADVLFRRAYDASHRQTGKYKRKYRIPDTGPRT